MIAPLRINPIWFPKSLHKHNKRLLYGSHHLANPNGFRNSEPGKGTKTKNIFLIINYNITAGKLGFLIFLIHCLTQFRVSGLLLLYSLTWWLQLLPLMTWSSTGCSTLYSVWTRGKSSRACSLDLKSALSLIIIIFLQIYFFCNTVTSLKEENRNI